MSNWRIIQNLAIFLPTVENKNLIYIANEESAAYLSEVIKSMSEYIGYNSFKISDLRVSIRFGENLSLCVKSAQLPDKDAWYEVGNFRKEDAFKIISENTLVNGEILGEEFEVIFSDDYPNEISFISSKMSGYNECMEEVRRRLSCTFGKKTKKFVEGHRYDSLEETIYYLGEFKSRKVAPDASEFVPIDQAVPVYLYTEAVRFDNIDDVFKNEVFGSGKYDIKIAYKLKSMVDSGEILKNNLQGGIQDYWTTIWMNSLNRYGQKDGRGNVRYQNILDIFAPLSILSKADIAVNTNMANEITVLLENLTKEFILNNWEIKTQGSGDLLASNSKEKNVDSIRLRLFTKSGCMKTDPNVMSIKYYNQLLNEFKVPSLDVYKNEIEQFSEGNLSCDFDEFYKNEDYFKRRVVVRDITLQQRKSSTPYTLPQKYIKDVYGQGTQLTETLVNIIDTANNNFGVGVHKYTMYNAGSKSKPMEFIDAWVTLDDVVKYCGGVDKMPEALKNEIASSRFCMINVKFDKGAKVE